MLDDDTASAERPRPCDDENEDELPALVELEATSPTETSLALLLLLPLLTVETGEKAIVKLSYWCCVNLLIDSTEQCLFIVAIFIFHFFLWLLASMQ